MSGDKATIVNADVTNEVRSVYSETVIDDVDSRYSGDWVRVVRCMKCLHHTDVGGDSVWCTLRGEYVEKEGFCHYGKTE